MNSPSVAPEISEINRIFEAQTAHKWVQKKTTAVQRLERIEGLKDALRRYDADIKVALAEDLNKSEDEATAELGTIYAELEMTGGNLSSWMEPKQVETSERFKNARAVVTFEARGIVLLFGPWNFPFGLVFLPLVQIVSAGNCAIVKPNEMSPATSAISAEIIREVFDEREVAVLEGDVDLANQLLELPVDHIFFTGSPAVGKLIMSAAAKHLASVTLELGGKNPVIVDHSFDMQVAAGKIAFLRNYNHGQVCLCPENIWVPEEKKDEFVAAAQGAFQAMFYQDGQLNPGACGKIVDQRNLNRVRGYIDDAREKGAQIVCGGGIDADQRLVEPTILIDLPGDARIHAEETFGPILSVFTYRDIDEVFAALQQQPKPLALYVFTEDESVVDTVLENTSSGGVTVNNGFLHCSEHHLPFGGVNHSGIGRYHGIHGFRELSHERAVLYTK